MRAIDVLVLVGLAAVSTARAQSPSPFFYEDFGDSLHGWTATRFYVEHAYTSTGLVARGNYDDTRACDLRRSFPGVQGWTLCRFEFAGDGSWIISRYGSGYMGLWSGSGADDTVKSFAIAGNFYSDADRDDRLPMACAVSRYTAPGGWLGFHMDAGSEGMHVLVDNVVLYALEDSLKLDSASYGHDVLIERMAPLPDNLFKVTYRGIPVDRRTLLVHLAPANPALRPGAFYVNDSAVASVHQEYWDYEQVSFGWEPHTDTASLAFWGVPDSVAFNAHELTLFCVDLDTSVNPASGIREGSRAIMRARGPSEGRRHLLVDIRGRSALAGQAPGRLVAGVYLHVNRGKALVVDRPERSAGH